LQTLHVLDEMQFAWEDRLQLAMHSCGVQEGPKNPALHAAQVELLTQLRCCPESQLAIHENGLHVAPK